MPEPSDRIDAALQAEIEAALGDLSVEDMMDFDRRPAARGAGRETRTGTIVGIHGDDVFVEFGPKTQGICPLGQFTEKPAVGDRLEFNIERLDRDEDLLVLSREGAIRRADWDALEIGQIVEARCTGVNKGGLELEIARHKAFMPAGQVDLRHIADLAVFVGEKLPCEVIELDRQRGRIVLSRRSFLESERARTRDDVLASLQVGATVAATISSIQPFGAFADLGGVDGLIHVSDLAHEHVKDPASVVKVGETVNVRILKIDDSSDPPRIGLGLKQTLADPFEGEAAKLEVGATVTGRVIRTATFGAFVEITPGVEGLIHISELSDGRVNRVESVVKEDEIVTVKVVSIDPERRRIGLSLKAMRTPEAQAEAGFSRDDDPTLKRLKAKFGSAWDTNLRGGL